MPSKSVANIISATARKYGLDEAMFRAFAGIESSFNPKARTGSYKGLYQLSNQEFKKYGPKGGNIYNAEHNAEAAAKSFKSRISSFKRRVGRDPTPNELYLSHQQGRAGIAAHSGNPEGIAWKNIRPYYTDAAAKRKGFKNGDAYAKAAVWGNLPPSAREKFQNVNNVTSGDFIKTWEGRVGRGLRRHGYTGEVGSSVYAGPPLPEQKPTLPERRSFGSLSMNGTLPEDRGFRANFTPEARTEGGILGEANPDIPARNPIINSKRQDIIRSSGDNPPLPERPPSSGILPVDGYRENQLRTAFGPIIGDIYAKQGSGLSISARTGVPAPVPLFKNIAAWGRFN